MSKVELWTRKEHKGVVHELKDQDSILNRTVPAHSPVDTAEEWQVKVREGSGEGYIY